MSARKVAVILENAPDCELDRAQFDLEDDNDLNAAIKGVIDSWVLTVGDTIRIVEVQP